MYNKAITQIKKKQQHGIKKQEQGLVEAQFNLGPIMYS